MSASRRATFACVLVFGVSISVASDRDSSANDEALAGAGASARREASPSTGVERASNDIAALMSSGGGPVLHQRLPEGVMSKLQDAIVVAEEHIQDHPQCQALFGRFGADGLETIRSTLYYPSSAEQERRYCRRGRSHAITTVGGSYVVPCRSFARLSTTQAAIIVIHESLHSAGQTEYPSDPDAPDAHEITRLVMRSCGLY